ncbi:MAG: zinc-ribbon domain-containing protein [Methanobacterium sp.]|nr:zinc-ribbon domain-containing protein [Methanobacterium sp.]MCC7559381.1 zinc-ribbon domain-containing protein [Methanobacterium sp.]
MYCPKCGTKNQDGAVFCETCGSRLTETKTHHHQQF